MLRIIAICFAFSLVIGCAESEATNGSLEVENLRLVQERNGTQTVSGVVRNTSDRTRSVQLEITMYGDRNRRLGAVHVPVEHIGAGEIKGFDMSLEQDVEGVRLRRIMTF